MIEISQYYGSPFEKWAKGFCYRNHWRVQHVLGGDLEDCYSQCALWWVACYNFYVYQQATVREDPHLMNMYKLWVTGQFNDLSTKDTKYKQVIVDPVSNELDMDYGKKTKLHSDHGNGRIDRSVGVNMEEAAEDPSIDLNLKLEKASSELKEVLNIMFNAPNEIIESLRKESSKQFFKNVVQYLKMEPSKAQVLTKELKSLLH